MVLWVYAIQRHDLIYNSFPLSLFQAQGKTPYECTFGIQGDMYNICNFGWHKWVYYLDHGLFPENKEKLGRSLGLCKNEGNKMSQSIVASNGYAITRKTIRSLRTSEMHSET